MPAQKLRNLNDNQISEIVKLYQQQDPVIQVSEIAHTYDLNQSTLYRLLKQQGIALRTQLTEAKIEQQETRIVVDDQSTVQEMLPVRRPRNLADWLVRFTGEVVVEAESIDEALAQARKLGVVKKIYSIRMRSE
jgi:hypothetical protein